MKTITLNCEGYITWGHQGYSTDRGDPIDKAGVVIRKIEEDHPVLYHEKFNGRNGPESGFYCREEDHFIGYRTNACGWTRYNPQKNSYDSKEARYEIGCKGPNHAGAEWTIDLENRRCTVTNELAIVTPDKKIVPVQLILEVALDDRSVERYLEEVEWRKIKKEKIRQASKRFLDTIDEVKVS